ncbi:hypothetical protein F444_16655 [Phytophthora nicotianae P1976]|uniref:Uncharacterized protein n=1 Tax=Phytophthora nicotianae P1976 TaxID=1317066 RepID=A0A080ZHI7_PHYNI|nr:hypothetical protein F444_16655 [Phytophthora nicotianae P1976]
MAEEAWPLASQVCFWIDPGTGEQAEFTLRHALDFAYYVDGGVEPIPATIGESFCRPPVQQLRQELPSKSAKNSDEDQLAGLFDPFVGDDDELPVGPSVDEQARLRPHEHAASKKRYGINQRQRTALDQDALIVEKLSGDPELLDRFLQVREASGKHRGIAREGNRRSTDLDAEEKRTPEKRVAPTSKYGFVPREDQQRVHERATAVRHKGKQPTAFCKGLIRSKHVKFKPLPGVCTRLFDLQFGSSGLSICHFALLSQASRQQPSLAEKKRLGRIPTDVLRRLPVQVDPATGETTALCMRYLSKYGCTEKDGACPSEHGHFILITLHDVVKAEINKRFGGHKNEHKRL